MKVEEEMKILEEIDRESIKNGRLLYNYEIKEVLDRFIDKHDNAPTVDMSTELSVAYLKGRRQGQSDIRPQGKWKLDIIGIYCSECKRPTEYSSNFCPNCGADMRGT